MTTPGSPNHADDKNHDHMAVQKSPQSEKAHVMDDGEARTYYEEEDCGSPYGSQVGMNNDLGLSSLTLNGHIPDVAGELLPIPPDGGYGWVIVFSAFMSNLIVDGICNAFTEFKGSYSQEFKASDATTALIGSLLIGMYLLVGPIVGGLVNKMGARKVVIIGSFIGAAGLGLSIFAPNIYVFMLLYGVVGGIGFGFIYLPAIVVVGFYFESKRAMATGIAVAGSGVGTIVMPMLSEYCIKTFGWKVAVVVLAVSVLSCAAFGVLYRPLTAPALSEECKDHELEPLRAAISKVDDEEMSAGDSPKKALSPMVQDNDPSMIRLRNALSECEGDDAANGKSLTAENEVSRSRAASTNKDHRPRKLTLTSMNSEMTSQHDLKHSRGNLASQHSKMTANSIAQSLSQLSKKQTSTLSVALSGLDPNEFARPMNRQDIFYGGSIKNLKEFKEENGSMTRYRGSVSSIPHSTIAEAANKQFGGANGDLNEVGSRIGGSRMSRMTGGLAADDELDEFYDDSKCKCLPLPVRNAFGEMIDVQLLKDPVMLLLCISNLLGMMGFYIPFVFLKDLATTHGISGDQSVYLVPVIGVTNTLGRVIFGWIADRGYVTALAINNFSLVSCGILTLLCPLLDTFPLMMIYASVFGFIISAYISLTSIVLTDLLGLEKLTNSFGLLVVARGIASLCGSPFAGLVYDLTQSYKAAFYFAGMVIVISGLISCAVPFMHNKKRSCGDNEEMEEEKKRLRDAEMLANGVVEEGNEDDAVEKL